MPDPQPARPPDPASPILGVAYPSFYFADVEEAAAYYGPILGAPAYREDGFFGIRLGDTWLTVFGPEQAPAAGANPRNAEIGLRLKTPQDVDALTARFVEAGARTLMAPQDTWMYETLRYACLDDALGVRWDLFCPIAGAQPKEVKEDA